MQKINNYFLRIGLEEFQFPIVPTLEKLQKIHRHHLFSIPFENLDIHFGKEITLSIPNFYTKIVEHKRGGFCFEMNGLFYWIITMLGYDADLISCRVANEEGDLGPDLDHLAMIVRIENTPYLCDVGFGISFLEPFELNTTVEVPWNGNQFKLTQEAEIFSLWRKSFDSEDYRLQYTFNTNEHKLGDFEDRCKWLQTSEQSHFTQKKLCSIATANGSVMLTNQRLVIIENNNRTEETLSNPLAFINALKHYFGISLEAQ